MTNTVDALYEMVRAPKRPFHNAGRQPGKARRHRQERHKAKECLKRRDWMDEAEQDR